LSALSFPVNISQWKNRKKVLTNELDVFFYLVDRKKEKIKKIYHLNNPFLKNNRKNYEEN